MQNDPEFLTDDSLLVQEHWLARYMATFRVAVLTVSLLASIAAAASEPEPVKVWVDVSGLDQSPLATLLRDELTESKYSWLALTAEDEDREAPYRLLDVKISDYEGKIQIQGKLEAPKGKTSRPTKVNCDECEVKDGKDAVERALHYLLNRTVLYWSVSPFGYLRAKECTNATDTRNDIVYFAYEFSDLEPMSSPDGDQIREGAILESPPYYRVGMLKEAGGIATIRPVEVYLQISDLDDVRVQTTFTAKLELKKGRTYDAARLCQEPNSNRVLTVQARPEKRQREEERQLELIQYPSPTTFGSALGGKEPSP